MCPTNEIKLCSIPLIKKCLKQTRTHAHTHTRTHAHNSIRRRLPFNNGSLEKRFNCKLASASRVFDGKFGPSQTQVLKKDCRDFYPCQGNRVHSFALLFISGRRIVLSMIDIII